ncbi:hypothetical protein MRY87_07820 [bacterium]|nr:hypothetical protein [bacterium]
MTAPTLHLNELPPLSSNSRNTHSAGASRITLLIFGFIGLFAFYTLYEVLPILYRYYDLQNQVESLAKRGDFVTDKEIRFRLKDMFRRYDMPITIDDVEIMRGADEMEIGFEYDDTIFVPEFFVFWTEEDIELYTFEFVVHADESFTGQKQRY